MAPTSVRPRAELSRLLLLAGRPAEALEAAEIALALDARHPEARQAHAAALAAIEALDPAVAALELMAVLRPDDPAPALELGHSYAELGQAEAAERAFRRALAMNPGSAPALAGLGALRLSLGDDDGAEHHSLAALAISPGHAVASQTLAAVLEARGDAAAAKARLDEAYARQSLFFEPAADSRMTVLVLATQSTGNVPYRRLMPPRLYSRLVWYMEHARPEQMATLPPHEVVFNAIGDADLAQASAETVARFAAVCVQPLLNAPDRVARTRRDRLGALLEGLEGVATPKVARAPAGEDLTAAARAEGLAGPLLVRPAGTHGGRGLMSTRGLEGLADLQEAFQDEAAYVAEFCDYRSADGRYRKGRAIFVDRRAYPYHWAVSDHWLVHYDTAGMGGAAERQAEERLFLERPEAVVGEAGWRAIQAIGARLDLDYAGLDFGVLPDGRILVFEANAAMLVHPEPEDGELAYKNPAVARIVEAFQARLAAGAQTPAA